ncbi:MAG: hypothetical protein ACOX1A_05365 [Saccharofermentanales bacterium]|jgi:hypothetical protein|nr:DUF5305 domain-containing protein [Clostridiaceae bacterium]
MKNSSQYTSPSLLPPGVRNKKHSNRHEMNRHLRRLLILILVLIIAAVALAAYASYFPVYFTLPVPIWPLRNSSINYEVSLLPNALTGQTTLGMDQAYLSAYAHSVNAEFSHQLKIRRATNLAWRYRIDAKIEVHTNDDSHQLLLDQTTNLIPETTGTSAGPELNVGNTAVIQFSDYEPLIKKLSDQIGQHANFTLTLLMPVTVRADLPEGPFEFEDILSLAIPLNQPSFTITESLPLNSFRPQWHQVGFRLVFARLALPIYPIIAGIAVLLMILLLLITRSRPKTKKNQLARQLKRKLHLAKGQLILIEDQAWEPERCVAVADFKSMVRTAKKLKYPIFCYIDQTSASLTAHFYLPYGENNYCYSFNSRSGRPALREDAPETALPSSAEPVSAEERIPFLPETDDSPDTVLAHLKDVGGHDPSLR